MSKCALETETSMLLSGGLAYQDYDKRDPLSMMTQKPTIWHASLFDELLQLVEYIQNESCSTKSTSSHRRVRWAAPKK